MKIIVLLISITCLSATIATAQKTVRKRPKTTTIQTTLNQTEQTSSDPNQTESDLADMPLKILDKPRAEYPTNGVCFQGKVVLRVTFLDSGQIGQISIISSLGNGATENAIEAARKIKFEPATKNGKEISVTKPVEYSFTIY